MTLDDFKGAGALLAEVVMRREALVKRAGLAELAKEQPQLFRSLMGALIGGGLLMLGIERRAARRPEAIRIHTVDGMRWPDALKVGFAQCVAMWPGVSRSGATIMGGMMFGLSRQAATEFSFFLAIPTMFAATCYDVAKNWELLRAEDLPVFTAGFAASFVFGLLAVKGLIYFVSRHTFNGFAWYRIAFGGVVLLTAGMGWVEWTAD